MNLSIVVPMMNEKDNVKADVETIYGGLMNNTLTGNTGNNTIQQFTSGGVGSGHLFHPAPRKRPVLPRVGSKHSTPSCVVRVP